MRPKKRSPVSEELKKILTEYLQLHRKAQEDIPSPQPAPQSEAASPCSVAPDQKKADEAPVQHLFSAQACAITQEEHGLPTALCSEEHALHPRTGFEDLRLDELQQRLQQKGLTFAEALMEECKQRSLTDAQLYKKAQVSRATFNKIIRGQSQPGKSSACALVLALELAPDQAEGLLQKAGISLSDNNDFDLIIRFCLEKGLYDIDTVNDILYERDQLLVGSSAR
ncbi:MAG: helix-turn-helix transcriptional regulator [Firmicutes bacterium]|nr:helix-turn-helix transcriptional regulator [Bacillota bacterium]